MNEIALRCESLTKSYGDAAALRNLDLHVHVGEIVAVVGPSGCGKTTLLRTIAGFEHPDSGGVRIGERLVAGGSIRVPPEKRGVGMVFQDYALFPHLTVAENVAFGLNGNAAVERLRRVRSMLRLVGLERIADRHPHELSGGERQRVALARALAPEPVLILLDEPFSNLDADRRVHMREEVRAILKGTNATAVFVTHDQEEALFMGDRLAVMADGAFEQVGAPEEVFHRPSSRFVARFMGRTDFLPGEVTEGGVQTEIGFLAQPLPLPAGTPVEVAFREDDVALRPDPAGQSLVLARQFRGAMNVYRVRLPSGNLIHACQPHTRILAPGSTVEVRAEPGHALACFHEGRAVPLPAE